MYVIFPADELILMTYGGPALPRIKPRPTLDCLRDPQVPFDLQRSTTANTTAAPTTIQKPDTASVNYPALPAEEFSVAPLPNHTTAYNYTNYNGYNAALPPLPPKPSSSTAASPTPSRRLSRSSLTRPEPGQATVTRSSLRSSTRSRQATPPLPPPPQQQQQQLLQQLPAKTATPPIPPMYNDPNMRATPKQPQQQQRAPTQRPPLEHCKSIQSSAPPKGILYDPAYYPGDERGAHHSGGNPSTPAYPSSTLANHPHRDRSPSIFLEPPSDVPTQPTWFGPGWGRPMSPMELPPEPPHSSHSLSGGGGAAGGGSSVGSKSPTSKSRLRPKLHIPLGRLGRSSSSDQRESHRLRDDTQLHVENPIFNRANLSAQNFDAFFESGEPVYKLQPKTPGTLSSDGSQGYSPEQLSSAAGVYESTASRNRGSGGGGLFARSPRDEKALSARSKSTEHYEPQQREERAPSVSKGGGGSGGSSGGGGGGGVPQKDFSGKSSSGRKSRSFFGWRGPRGGSLGPKPSMASYNGVLKDYGHSSLNEAFKSQNNVNFKLIKTVSDFTETLSQLYEEHATALQTLVSNYRKKNGELRKERPACHLTIFQAWETFLQEVETDSQASNDVASVLSRQVSRPMLDKSFHRKVQSRKIFTHRESFETIIAKTEEKLSKCRLDYKQCYVSHRQNPTQLSLTEYIDAHNAYVQQLHATNAMLEIYHCETVPQLMQELEEIHNDLCSIIADSILQGADVIATKATDQAKRYSNLTSQCGSITPTQDLTNFVRILPLPSQAQKVPRRIFAPPQPAAGQLAGGDTDDGGDYNEMTPLLRNELIFDRHSTLSLRPALESLKREAIDLEIQIRQLQDSIDVLNRTQSRGIEGQLYNKVNELQEDLSMKKFDLRAKQIHLAAIRSQKELFVSKVDPGSPRAERKLSAASAPSMKTKWLKAFRSLKPASGSAAPSDRRNGAAGTSSQPLRPNEDGSHHLQEYTYKKITACDVCSQILRGHTRQGLRCRICKLNAHGDCASQLPRCQPKQKLLRRQKSTSELENRVDVEEERPYEDGGGGGFEPVVSDENHETLLNVPSRKFRQKTPFIDRIAQLEFTDLDQIYRVLKQAGELKSAHLTAAVAADKSVHIEGAGGAGHVSSITTIVTQPDIPIVNVPECPERQGATAIGASSMTTGGGGGSVVGGLGVGGGFAAAAGRVARGIRPPPVSMPILGVQLQQQELQQQRGALPVPAPDISSSSDYRLPGNVSQIASVAGMSTSAYISGGIGINYYTATGAGGVGNVVVSSTTAQQQQQQTLQQQQQQFVPDTGLRRRLFAGFRPLSGFGRLRSRSSQHRSISLPETPHSPRRQKLNLRMKSLSLDSPESSELHGQIRRRQQPGAPGAGPSTGGAGGVYYHGGSGGHLEHSTPPSNNSRLHSPSSPSHQGRKLLYASRGMRGGSVDLPDEMEKSQSSASTSPCPSPVRIFQKSHRLLPTNLYVILYNFKARHADELDLKAGYKVTVIDTSDPDWWKGKVLGRVGYFPSKYCVRLNANEKPLQVTHNLQVSDGERGENMTLLRDQIVIQTGDEVNGMVTVRSADNRQGYCPIKYLQEV